MSAVKSKYGYSESAGERPVSIMRLVYKENPIIDKKLYPKGVDNHLILWNNVNDFIESQLEQARSTKGVHGKISKKSKIFISDSDNIIDQIKTRLEENKKEMFLFDSIMPLLNNEEFIDLVLINRIGFSSINDTEIACKFAKSLIYISKKRELRKAGNPNVGSINIEPANALARKIGPIVDEIHENGLNSYGMKADYLNDKGYPTLRGKEWSRSSARNTWLRWQKLKAEEESKNTTSSKTPKPE